MSPIINTVLFSLLTLSSLPLTLANPVAQTGAVITPVPTLIYPPPHPTICPTLTHTTVSPGCPVFTPRCATPDCIVLEPITMPCGCKTPVSTATTYKPCQTACNAGCGTAYTYDFLPCPATSISTSTSTTTTFTPISDPTPTITKSPSMVTSVTQPTTCRTITNSGGPGCWHVGCPVPLIACVTTQIVGLGCGCRSIPITTICPTSSCGGICATTYKTVQLGIACPAPYTMAA